MCQEQTSGLIRSYINLLQLTPISQSCQQRIFIQSTTFYPWSTLGCSLLMQQVLSKQPVLSGITSDASATAVQLRVTSIHREGSLPYPPVAGFQVPYPQNNDIRAAQAAELVEETKYKSSSKQAKM